MLSQIGTYLYTPISISVCYIISLGYAYFDWHVCVLQLWMCAYAVLQSTFRVLKGHTFDIILNPNERRIYFVL
jgi:hypothetical protein